jgi:hypothetical protein
VRPLPELELEVGRFWEAADAVVDVVGVVDEDCVVVEVVEVEVAVVWYLMFQP